MNAMRALMGFVGAILTIAGLFFALQGAGIIMWPASSFMLANRSWVGYGLAIAAVGIVLAVLARRRPA